MSRIVVDASAVIAVIANEPERAQLISLTKGMAFVAPASLNWEVGNAFSAMLKRKRITEDQAIRAIGIFKTITIEKFEVDIESAIRLAARFNLYAYDAYLIECAIEQSLPLITLDKNLVKATKQAGVTVIEVEQ
jgi:predicted nucleic acid-binding protein